MSDFHGYYRIMNIPPGCYSVKISFVAYRTKIFENIKIEKDKVYFRNVLLMSPSYYIIPDIEIYKVPLIDPE